MIDVEQSKALLDELEHDPERIQLYRTEIESMISGCMDEVHMA